MKRFLLLALLACVPAAFGGTKRFAWDVPNGVSPADIAGSNFYIARVTGSTVGPYTKVNASLITTLPTTAAPYVATIPDNGATYNAYATFVFTSGKESAPSNVVPFDAGTVPPVNAREVPAP